MHEMDIMGVVRFYADVPVCDSGKDNADPLWLGRFVCMSVCLSVCVCFS